MDFLNCSLKALSREVAANIMEWEYDSPYDVYSFKDRPNGYLLNESTWGTEQFCLMEGESLLGYATAQLDMGVLWVGWALAPQLCGKGQGNLFVSKCVSELRRIKAYDGAVYLRVAAWNMRAIRAYEETGFVHVMTIEDEAPYTGKTEDFWVMARFE